MVRGDTSELCASLISCRILFDTRFLWVSLKRSPWKLEAQNSEALRLICVDFETHVLYICDFFSPSGPTFQFDLKNYRILFRIHSHRILGPILKTINQFLTGFELASPHSTCRALFSCLTYNNLNALNELTPAPLSIGNIDRNCQDNKQGQKNWSGRNHIFWTAVRYPRTRRDRFYRFSAWLCSAPPPTESEHTIRQDNSVNCGHWNQI